MRMLRSTRSTSAPSLRAVLVLLFTGEAVLVPVHAGLRLWLRLLAALWRRAVVYADLVAVLANPGHQLRGDLEGDGLLREGLAVELGGGELGIGQKRRLFIRTMKSETFWYSGRARPVNVIAPGGSRF
jgi:hypothetical protein